VFVPSKIIQPSLVPRLGASMGEIGKWRQLNETEWYGAVRDVSFFLDEMDLKILVQASFNEWDRDFLKFGLNEFEQFFTLKTWNE
jgi:hypothetical protein